MRNISCILLLLLFITPIFGYAQKIIDLGDADDFILQRFERRIIASKKLKSGSTRVTTVTINNNGDSINYVESIVPKDKYRGYAYAIKTDSVKPMTLYSWGIHIMKGKSFTLKESPNRIISFTYHTPYLMTLNKYYQHEKEEKPIGRLYTPNFAYHFMTNEPLGVCYIRFGTDKYAVLLTKFELYSNNIEGLIVPYHNRLEILEHSVDYNNFFFFGKADLAKYTQNLRTDYFYKTAKCDDGKQILTDFFRSPQPIVGDSVFFIDKDIVVFEKAKKSYSIFSKFQEKYPIKNIRAISGNQLLIDTKLKWLLKDGKLAENIPPLTYGYYPTVVTEYSNSLDKDEEGNLFLEKTIDRTNAAENDERRKYTLRDDAVEVDSIFFAKKEMNLRYDEHTPRYEMFKYMLVKKKNGMYNICSFETSDKDSTFFLTNELDMDCDNVSMTYPTYFYKNSQAGYFPTMTKVKYKSILELNGNFLRIQTIKGEKGWLDIQRKEEYLD